MLTIKFDRTCKSELIRARSLISRGGIRYLGFSDISYRSMTQLLLGFDDEGAGNRSAERLFSFETARQSLAHMTG